MVLYRITRAVVLPLCRLLFRVKVVGRERVPRDGVYIVAPSHRSILDIPFTAFITPRRLRFMAKRELFKTRIGRVLFGALGAIEVDRGMADRAALRRSQAALEQGELLAIFPEGTRRSGPVLGDLYDGVAYLALKLRVPIVPVGVGGSEAILASGKVMPRLHKVVVVVGEPITPDATTPPGAVRRRSDMHALTEELQRRLQECFDEACRRAGVSAALVREGSQRD